ncbi:MAG: tetratricopeptide repeat protein [Magnetococcus sp. DMHC-6]
MTWLWFFPLLILFTFSLVFSPLFTNKGRLPLPIGREPVGKEKTSQWDLKNRKDTLLRQIKELEYELAAGNLEALEGQNQRQELEQELIGLLKELDHAPNNNSTSKGDKKLSLESQRPLDIASGVAVMVLVAMVSSGLYLALGTPELVPSPKAEMGANLHDMEGKIAGLADRLKNEPDNLSGWMQLGKTYAVMGRTPEAILAFEHILSRQPNDLEAAVLLGENRIRDDRPGQLQKGLELFQQILAKNPERPEPYWFLGALALRAGERDKAIELWEKLAKILPVSDPAQATVQEALKNARSGTP